MAIPVISISEIEIYIYPYNILSPFKCILNPDQICHLDSRIVFFFFELVYPIITTIIKVILSIHLLNYVYRYCYLAMLLILRTI